MTPNTSPTIFIMIFGLVIGGSIVTASEHPSDAARKQRLNRFCRGSGGHSLESDQPFRVLISDGRGLDFDSPDFRCLVGVTEAALRRGAAG